jgi:hypothetical protein
VRYPFDGSFVVTSPYGWRPGGFHRGIDFGLPEGTPLVSVGDGVVFFVGYESDGGNCLAILLDDPPHPSAPKAGYMHLQGFAVGQGDRVREGQVLGWSDTTGASVTGPHLHFWMGENANVRAVDPTPFFDTTPARPATPPLPDFHQLLCALNTLKGDHAVAMIPDYFGNEVSLHVNRNGDLVHNSFDQFGNRTPPDEVLLTGCNPDIQPAARVANENLIVTCVGAAGNLRRSVFIKAEARWDTSMA